MRGKAKYPEGTSFVNGYKTPSKYVNMVSGKYPSIYGASASTTSGCGGWMALVSDYIFGRNDFPARKVSVENVRPGDIEVQLDGNGKARHLAIVTSKPIYDAECDVWRWNTTDGTDDRYTGKTVPYYVTWKLGDACWPDMMDQMAHFYTRYPS